MASIVEKKWQSRMASIGEAVKYLFNNPLLSDVTFSCVDNKGMTQLINAHSFVLIVLSPVFHDELQENISKPHVIPITEYSYETFMSFMRYLYGAEFAIDTQNAMELMNLGQQYEVDCLENEFNDYIANVQLTLENICNYLELSVKAKNEVLNNKTNDFIEYHGKKLIVNESFNNLSTQALKEILSREEEIAHVSEVEIFDSVIKWAEHRCLNNNLAVNPINMRRSLGELIKLIRFTGMTIVEFVECIENYKGLLSMEEERSLMISIVKKKTDENELKFWKPREVLKVNLDQLNIQVINFFYSCASYKPCSSFQNKFVVNTPIYLTQLIITDPDDDQNVKIVFGVDGVIIHENEQIAIKNKWIRFVPPKPIKLLPGRQYYCDFICENPNANFDCGERKNVPFTETKGGVSITFSEWSPLLNSFQYKQLPVE